MSDCDVESHIDDTIQISTLEPARAVLSEQQKYRKSFNNRPTLMPAALYFWYARLQ